jgi:hypothetical protein
LIVAWSLSCNTSCPTNMIFSSNSSIVSFKKGAKHDTSVGYSALSWRGNK